jgi:2-polyprenyl-3-methyl-5-hydroxy-6-metoxy-1,4-benzoquinol methylase
LHSTNSNSSSLRPCPLCGDPNREKLYQRDEWEIVQCASCDMVFIGSNLSYEKQVEEHDWLDDYSKEKDRRREKHPAMLYLSRLTTHFRPKTNDRLLAQTMRWALRGNLVDFGCGDGSFLERATSQFAVKGIEISPRGAELSRQRVGVEKILEGPVTEVAAKELPAGSFDVVTQFGYLEHEWQPLAGLRAAYRVLKPGGVTVVKTPNFASWNRHVMGLDWCGFHIPAHCNYFTPDTLAKMVRLANFEPLPRPLIDQLPTSDSLWMAARKPG